MKRFTMLVVVVVCGSFLVTGSARASTPTLQQTVLSDLDSLPGLHSYSVTPNFVVGSSTSNGFTMHFSVDIYGTTKIGWTIQPHTVGDIDNWMRNNPATVAAGVAAMAMAGAAACGALLTGLGVVACETIFAVWVGFMVDKIHQAHTQNACVTIKVNVNVFTVFDPAHLVWNGFPYVDTGSWCNRTVYITPPAPPNPQGPRTPGGCAMDPTNPACTV